MTKPVSRQAFMLGTLITLTVYEPEQEPFLEEALALIERYESMLSVFRRDSQLYAVNHRAEHEQCITVSEELFALVERGLYLSEVSGGVFDISTEPLSRLWNVNGEEQRIPGDEEIRQALLGVGREKISLHRERRSISFSSPFTRIDLGGLAKGYIADRVKELLVKSGVSSGIINLGGNVLCIGGRPDGGPFRVGVQRPFAHKLESRLVLEIRDKSVVSSGVYERGFVKDGHVYHHIMDPRSGRPFVTDTASVTVISSLSSDGDGLSSACLALGWEKGCGLLDSMEGVCGVFILNDGQLRYSRGVQELLSGS